MNAPQQTWRAETRKGSVALRSPLVFIAFFLAALPANASEHWSLQARTQCKPPAIESKWIRNPIDAFVLERLQKAGLKPAPEADAATLIRRITYDLTGLPPTPEETRAFEQDARAKSQAALEGLVDRLLASPRYGERWGRHWLDVVRYAESEGFEYDRYRPGAWRYRDYVIKAFNKDLPFDRFLLEQIAGDELAVSPSPRGRGVEGEGSLVAAGFHRLGPVRRNAGNKLVAFSRNEVLTEMTDAIGATFLGLTMGCARCHDHRFDDISQKDYYHLQAFLASAQEHDLVLADAKTQAEWKEKTDAIQKQIKQLQKQTQTKKDASLEKRIAELRRSLPEPLPTISTVKNGERTPIHVLKRGDADKKGAPVGPRALSALLSKNAPESPADLKNPRTELAKWLNDAEHPLVARVFVNRLWQGHFGKGIVATANDFGVNGASPSHPELLDWLVNEFIANGRSIKPLHRMILLSSTYRQASVPVDPPATRKLDPDNKLLSHFQRRRLSSEEVRDAMLSASGKLNLKAGGPSVMVPVEKDLTNLLYDPSQWAVTPDEREHDRRTVYLAVKRNLQLPFSQVFDQPDAAISCQRRESSTHPLQALELLNGKLSNRLAEALAERLVRECGNDPKKQVDRAFLLAAGRAPTAREREVALEFLRSQSLREYALAMFNLNAFMYVD
jgi:DNA-binding transcriptional MerR regulator